MLLISTYLAPSPIHGIGVFSREPVAARTEIWRFEPGLDLVIPDERLVSLPPAFRTYLDTYAYRSLDVPDGTVLSCDHAKFFNHSDDPNTLIRPFVTLASRDIQPGDEITCDYGAFVVGWSGFD